MRKLKYLIFALCMSLTLTGCVAHVDKSDDPPGGTTSVSVAGVSFYVPEGYYNSAEDYHAYLNQEYTDQEAADAALLTLVQGDIKGSEADRFLLTNAREYMFFVADLASDIDLSTCTREKLGSMLAFDGLEILNYGRMITEYSEVEKAVMQIDFRVSDAMGVMHSYRGYFGLAKISGTCYGYIAGYNNADEERLKQCFDCVRTLS